MREAPRRGEVDTNRFFGCSGFLVEDTKNFMKHTANNRQTNEKKKITCVSLYSRHTCFKKLFFSFLLANIWQFFTLFENFSP